MIFTNARILTFAAANRVLDSGSVEAREDGAIGFVRPGRPSGGDVVDAGGRILMPALINCHTHLYSTFARGLRINGRPPGNFRQILKKLWWRLDRALELNDVYASALAGLIESAKCGVGTVIDHHSSPNACTGSLDAVERAFRKVGLRGATCYEVSDRNGRESARQAMRENIRFIEGRTNRKQVGAAFGLHASFTLSDRTLRRCVEVNQSFQAPFHVHVAEDNCDRTAVRRLANSGVLNERTLAAHCVHVSAGDRSLLARLGVNVVHNPQSNCNNAVGAADISKLSRGGVLVGLGSDGYTVRLWEEFKSALNIAKLQARDSRAGDGAVLWNNRAIVRKLWGFDVGRIETGARADFILVDYFPPTPIEPPNVFSHLLFGISNAPVHTLVVDGRYVVREGRCINVDERRAAEKAAARAKSLWERL